MGKMAESEVSFVVQAGRAMGNRRTRSFGAEVTVRAVGDDGAGDEGNRLRRREEKAGVVRPV